MSIVTRPENGKKETNLNELYDEPVDIFLFSFVLCFISAHVFIQIIMGWKKKKNGGLAGLKKLVMFLLSCSSGTVFSAYIAKSHSPPFFFLL